MPTNKIASIGGFLILPALYGFAYAARNWGPDLAIGQWLPKWDTLIIFGAIIILERTFKYEKAVSQSYVLIRDLFANGVNLYVTGALASVVFLPILFFFPETVLGRQFLISSPQHLGPLWLQVPIIILFVSFFRYWMHRIQHKVPFLWKLHSYHHQVTDIRASNTLVSHPIDFALRNMLAYFVLLVVGFHPVALLIAVPITLLSGTVSHCGTPLKGAWLNYLFMTPEVHRWHHSATIPDGHKYAVNYGVEFSFWDVLFGTFHLPKKEGRTMLPERLGHPDGRPDEISYLKLLLVPLGLYGVVTWLRRKFRAPRGPGGQQPAE